MTDASPESLMFDRRSLFGMATTTVAASQSGLLARAALATTISTSAGNFGSLRRINAGLLSIGYVEIGPRNGMPVFLPRLTL